MNKILIIEDSLDLQFLYRFVFEDLGYEVTDAVNGLDALKILETECFNLVISDYHMPIMDGATFIKEYRKLLYKTPLLFITGSETKNNEADYSIKKPFDVNKLIELVNTAIKS